MTLLSEAGLGRQTSLMGLSNLSLDTMSSGCSQRSQRQRAWAGRHVPTAVLSRQTAGLRGRALILNLPGKPKAIRETIDEVRCSARRTRKRRLTARVREMDVSRGGGR